MNEIDSAERVAEYLGVPARTLGQWRYVGKGPAYAVVGRHVRYRRADVDAWVAEHTVRPAFG
jgi:excisionase family DNA binding protein